MMANRWIQWLSGAALLFGLGLAAVSLPRSAQASVVIEWTTASELDTVGFHLYRSDQPEAEPVRITGALIEASPDPLTGGAYRYVDREVRPGQTYYYWLEDVETSGAVQRHGPEQVQAQRDGLLTLAAGGFLALLGALGLYQNRRMVT